MTFDDLPAALHVRYDDAVHIGRADAASAQPAGDALTLVESIAGRAPARPAGTLPNGLDAQLSRGAEIL